MADVLMHSAGGVAYSLAHKSLQLTKRARARRQQSSSPKPVSQLNSSVSQRTELSVDNRLYVTASGLFITLRVVTIAAIGYAALALAFVRRRGLIVLGPTWFLASVTATAALIGRTAYERSYCTLTDAFAGPSPPVAFHLLLMCALGFGAVTLLVARGAQRGKVAFGMGPGAGSAGACLLGVILSVHAGHPLVGLDNVLNDVPQRPDRCWATTFSLWPHFEHLDLCERCLKSKALRYAV